MIGLLEFLCKLAEDSRLTKKLVTVQPKRRPTDPRRYDKFPVFDKELLEKKSFDMAYGYAEGLIKSAYSDKPGDEAYPQSSLAPNVQPQQSNTAQPARINTPNPLAPNIGQPSIAPNQPAPAPLDPMIGAAVNPYAVTPGRKKKRDSSNEQNN